MKIGKVYDSLSEEEEANVDLFEVKHRESQQINMKSNTIIYWIYYFMRTFTVICL